MRVPCSFLSQPAAGPLHAIQPKHILTGTEQPWAGQRVPFPGASCGSRRPAGQGTLLAMLHQDKCFGELGILRAFAQKLSWWPAGFVSSGDKTIVSAL